MIPFNHAQTFLGDFFGTLEPEVTYRGAGSVVAGDVVAFPTNFAAYTNDSAAVSKDRTSANFLWRNVVGLSTANTQLGILAVVIGRGGSAGGQIQVSLFNPDIQVLIAGGTGATEAAGDFLIPNIAIATPGATAKTLYGHNLSALDSLTAPTNCYGFTNEAAPDSTPALKSCFFVGCGYRTLGGA